MSVYKKYVLASSILLLGSLVLCAMVYGSIFRKPQEIACTMDAMMCPDGSAVGRTGPSCEFAKCPDAKATTSTSSDEVIEPVIVPVGCTKEAKICPDGSSVGRVAPSCTFAECPIIEEPVAESYGSIVGTVLLGPVCPVERIPPDPECAPRPLATKFMLLSADLSKTVKTFSSDAQGKFIVDVPPGKYIVQPQSSNLPFPRCESSEVLTVPINDSVEVTISCDTGIR